MNGGWGLITAIVRRVLDSLTARQLVAFSKRINRTAEAAPNASEWKKVRVLYGTHADDAMHPDLRDCVLKELRRRAQPKEE